MCACYSYPGSDGISTLALTCEKTALAATVRPFHVPCRSPRIAITRQRVTRAQEADYALML
jgi:hypothetical protein